MQGLVGKGRDGWDAADGQGFGEEGSSGGCLSCLGQCCAALCCMVEEEDDDDEDDSELGRMAARAAGRWRGHDTDSDAADGFSQFGSEF